MTLQERMRALGHLYGISDYYEAADALDAKDARIKELEGALLWYSAEAEAIAKNLAANNEKAVLASVTALSLDCGARARAALKGDR